MPVTGIAPMTMATFYQHMEPKRRCDAHDQKHSRAIFRALSILH